MPLSATSPSAGPATDLTQLGAADLARKIGAREISSVEATKAFIARILHVDQSVNAVVVRLFDAALHAAKLADETVAHGHVLGPLHGVPITVKECFFLAGTASSIGLAAHKGEIATQDGTLVDRLRRAGAIVLGKTNLPQLMIWHECDNPVYGCTNNPWDLTRTPGGSTGGEAAIIAARGSPLGLGNDLGGSIRIPCHFCGIHGFKPTAHRLPRGSSRSTLRGMEAVVSQAGPLARRVEDLSLAMRVLADNSDGQSTADVPPLPFVDPAGVGLRGMKVALWTNDGFFAASPAIQRAVREAGRALEARGMIVEEFRPPEMGAIMETYFAILGSDGGTDARKLIANSPLDWRVRKMLRVARIPNSLRPPLITAMNTMGQRWMGRLISAARPRSASGYWQLIQRKNELLRQFLNSLSAGGYEAFLCPPHALPAPQHRRAIDLLPASSYSLFPNLLGSPAGVVSITRVREGEESSRAATRDQTDRQAAATERGSAGLPVGVQVCSLHWRDEVALAIMAALEVEFASRGDYPGRADVPTL